MAFQQGHVPVLVLGGGSGGYGAALQSLAPVLKRCW